MQVKITAKRIAPSPPHLNMVQRMYFMANKDVKETPVKSRKQIARFFIFRSVVIQAGFLNKAFYNLAPCFLSRLAISIFPLAIAICKGPLPSEPCSFTLAP